MIGKAIDALFDHKRATFAEREERTCKGKTFAICWDLNICLKNLEKWGGVSCKRKRTRTHEIILYFLLK